MADANGDGKLDIITSISGGSTVGVLLGTGTGSFGPVTTVSTGPGQPTSVVVADMNQDGRPDIVVPTGVLLGAGAGSFNPIILFNPTATQYGGNVKVADVNGDGQLDVVLVNNDSVAVLLGTGTGSFSPVTYFSTSDSSGNVLNSIDVAVADVNGDNRPDLLTANARSRASVLLNTGTYTLQATVTSLTDTVVQLYPNPAAGGRVRVDLPAVAGAATVQATLLDALGRVVQQQSAVLPAAGTTLMLNVAGLAAGVYFLRLQAGSSVLARRVVLN